MNELTTKPTNLNLIPTIKKIYTKEEKEALIIIQEKKVRNMFINQFKDYFKSIEELSISSSMDLSGLTYSTLNGLTTTYIELKERSNKYSVYTLSGSTYLEHIKLKEFNRLYKLNNQSKLVYFNYFMDGYISFDITNRIKARTSEVLAIYYLHLKSDNYGGYSKTKEVHTISYNPTDYNDKLIVYPKNNNTSNNK